MLVLQFVRGRINNKTKSTQFHMPFLVDFTRVFLITYDLTVTWATLQLLAYLWVTEK